MPPIDDAPSSPPVTPPATRPRDGGPPRPAPDRPDAGPAGWRLLVERRSLLGIEKAAGLLSVPGLGPANADCLIARVQQRFPEVRIVHRLDQATSGVLVLARCPLAHRALGWQFERREVEKRYVAIVAGHPERDGGVIDLPLRKALAAGPRHTVDPVHGKAAITRWRVVERLTLGELRGRVVEPEFDGDLAGAPQDPSRRGATTVAGADDEAPIARLDLHPETGRSHQLRVHLLAIGHPILGDDLYAPPEIAALSPRLLLHSERLVVRDPDDETPIEIASPPRW